MKKILATAVALVALPIASHAQGLQGPGLYLGIEGGLNGLLQSTSTVGGNPASLFPRAGFAAGAVIGWDFVGPRLELEGNFRRNDGTVSIAGPAGNFNFAQQTYGAMANAYYDFFAGSFIVPYIGAGAGVAFVNGYSSDSTNTSTQFAYQGILGLGLNINEAWRVNLDGRYYATAGGTNLNFGPAGSGNFRNDNITAMLSLHYKFGRSGYVAPAAAPAPAQAAPPSFMVFFDFDRSNLSAQAESTIQQAAAAYKSKGSARVTATGHADKSGPDAYNMALSLRRANAVKDSLVRNGVPATAIAVVGRGESMPLVQTADGVREPQNRRVEIVVQ